MSEENKVVELGEEELQAVDGGSATYSGHRIITGISKACGDYDAGWNFYNDKILAVKGTCGACTHMMKQDGWHLCDLHKD